MVKKLIEEFVNEEIDVNKTGQKWFEYDEPNGEFCFPCCICEHRNRGESECQLCKHYG